MKTHDEPQKPLTAAEQRALLKEQLKAQYLAELKAQKQQREAEPAQHYLNNAMRALEEMTRMTETDDTDAWIERLNGESLLAEAKLEMALPTTHTAEATEEDTTEQAESPHTKTLGDSTR